MPDGVSVQRIRLCRKSSVSIVALRDLAQGDIIENDGQRIQLVTDVPAKHKFTREPVPVGGIVTLYGVPVGKAVAPLQSGERITVDNVVHYAAEVDLSDAVPYMWKAPSPAGRTARSTA